MAAQKFGGFSEGDYVFYCDSGAFVFRSVLPVIEGMNDCDIWASNTEFIDEQWTKPEVFTRLGITDSVIKSSNQICASYVIARKSAMSLEFMREWLRLCTVPELIKPLEPGEPRGECIEHREDQSLFSVLCKLRWIKPHKPPYISAKVPASLLAINSLIKTLKGIKPAPKSDWSKAKRVNLTYTDTYEPFIFHHRIRTARSMTEFILKLFAVMGLKTAAKIFMRRRVV